MSESDKLNFMEKMKPWMGWLVFGSTMLGVFLLGLLAASIMERRQEAARLYQAPVNIADNESDSAVWGQHYPRQYDRYKKMSDSETKTKYGGAYPRDYLEETSANVILFAGYGFSQDYLQARGHIYAIEDVTQTKRVNEKTPATCWTCKSPDVPRLMAQMGPEKFYAKNFNELKNEITHPIGCLDCHDPKTMGLRISRPALVEAYERQGKDIAQATHQEMRSLVCAQCHVEYYFKGEGKSLTFPWDEGMAIADFEKYYNDRDFKDWTHAISKAPMVKMQHPDYEVYSMGIHSYRNVSCADCHMPYRTEGGEKITDHYVQSPLLNIANSCAVCHRWGESEIHARVEKIQDKNSQARKMAEHNITRAHFDIAACMQAGANDRELKEVRALVRRAQMYWDYVAANNGMGFHAPQECQRVLGMAASSAQEVRVICARILAKHGYLGQVRYPDFGSKEKSQKLIQLFIKNKPPLLLTKK